jgi:hypothetical protein
MTWPAPTRHAHEQFCKNEGWQRMRDARGRAGTHHITYELELPDGRILRTRVSHPPDRTTYGSSMWAHILRDQLDVAEEQFWACVRDGIRPDRGVPEIPAEALPADLVFLLVNRVGLAEADVAAMTRDDALARLQLFWTEGT